jgi:hypothetical protein
MKRNEGDRSRFAKHAAVYHTCPCGRRVTGNAIWRHKRACKVWLASLRSGSADTVAVTSSG